MIALENISCEDFSAMKDARKIVSDEEKAKANGGKAPINLSADVDEKLVAFCGVTRKKRSVVNAVMKWFLDLDPNVQRVVLNETNGLEDYLIGMLRGMIAEIEAKKHDPHVQREIKSKRTAG